MINIGKIKQNAENINENGLDATVLKEAEKLFNYSEGKAKEFFPYSKYGTHVEPETIAYYMQLFDGSLEGVKTLDLGCGTGRFYPVLPFALKELGAEVSGVDITPENDEGIKNMIEEGINYKKLNLNNPYVFDHLKDFLGNKDVIIARSFLDGGLYEDDDKIPIRGEEREFQAYKRMVDGAMNQNTRPILAELDFPDFLLYEKNIIEDKEVQEFLEKEIGEKIITGRKNFSSDYRKPFFLFEPFKFE